MSDLVEFIRARRDLPDGLVYEVGLREKGPQDPDWDISSPWVERVPDGTAKMSCGDHFTTGWQPTDEVPGLMIAHLWKAHRVEAEWPKRV